MGIPIFKKSAKPDPNLILDLDEYIESTTGVILSQLNIKDEIKKENLMESIQFSLYNISIFSYNKGYNDCDQGISNPYAKTKK